MAKLAGHNAKDGLSQHGILGFGNENTAENTTTNNENDASKTASTTSTGSNPGRSRWGNLIHVSYRPNYLLTWGQIFLVAISLNRTYAWRKCPPY